jgi:hypothetical protein
MSAFVLNVVSALCAFAAAIFWLRVALTATPEQKSLTADMTNFDWITKPLCKQARFNRYGAGCAGLAALFQTAALIVSSVSIR